MAQVVVYGPNGARTTANTTFTEADKAAGFTKSEYERLIAGEIPGREGYKGATQQEPLTPDYPGDYGGEDASTPMSERESVVGVGNTNYDPKDYSNVGPDGEVIITQDGVPIDSAYARTIPAGGEIVKVNDKYYILYQVPESNFSISYEASEEDIKGLYPIDFDKQVFDTLSEAEFNGLGAIDFGNIAELYDPRYLTTGVTPWEGFIDYLDKEAELRPWLADEEMVFLLAEATLEGRTVTETEWKTTNWWRTHTQDERDWLLLSQGKSLSELPADALSKVQDDKIAIRNAMIEAGISNPPDDLINWVSNKYTTGEWSNVYTNDQISLVADPSKVGNLDSNLQAYLAGDTIEYDTTRAGEDRIKQLYKRYLGPIFGDVSQTLIAEEAGKLRNDSDYELTLINKLTQQKKSIFPQYAEDITYEEFAAPWENFTTNQWGQQVDTSSDYFQEVLKLNDSTKASKYLTEKGLQLGVDKVVNEALDALKVFGQGVRIQ